MEVKINQGTEVCFKEIDYGTMFVWGSNVYLKMFFEDSSDWNAVELGTGEIYGLHKNDRVIEVRKVNLDI